MSCVRLGLSKLVLTMSVALSWRPCGCFTFKLVGVISASAVVIASFVFGVDGCDLEVVEEGDSQLGVIGGKVRCVPSPGAGPGLLRGFFQAGTHGSDAFWLLLLLLLLF